MFSRIAGRVLMEIVNPGPDATLPVPVLIAGMLACLFVAGHIR